MDVLKINWIYVVLALGTHALNPVQGFNTTATYQISTPLTHVRKCRMARTGYHVPDEFNTITCGSCFEFLFGRFQLNLRWTDRFPKFLFDTSSNITTTIIPDIFNKTIHGTICSFLTDDQCKRWTECCKGARECCKQQLSEPELPVSSDNTHCPRTWDGFACWGDADAGKTYYQSCPDFIEHSAQSGSALKTCTKNGTWYKDGVFNKEWTDYIACLDLQSHQIKVYISVGCLAGSLLVLIPSVVIFLVYRPLRTQHRIRLHLNLFASFIINCVVDLLWYLLIVHDRMVTATEDAAMFKNEGWCKFVNVLTRYTGTTNFMWMFCEAYHLHRLIVNAFEPPKTLLLFYILGWGFPWIPVIIYTAIKAAYGQDRHCWLDNFGGWEWIIYTPNLLSLVLNLAFLCNILRILLTQLQSHPNEPSNYRRAFKATFILVPLFGLQLLAIIYSPSPLAPGYKIYDIVSAIIVKSQGFSVALIFCLLNGEVLSLLKRSIFRHTHQALDLKRASTASTQFTTDNYNSTKNSHRPSKSYIPMTVVSEHTDNGV